MVALAASVTGTFGVARAVAFGFGDVKTIVGVLKAAVIVATFDTVVLPRSSVAIASMA